MEKIKLSLQKASETNPSRWTLLVATEFKQSDWQKWKELREQYPGIALEVLTKSAMERVILDNRDSLALEFIELFPAGEVAMSYFRLQKSMSKPLITPEQTDPPIITRYENADLKLINDNELRRIRRDAEKFTQLFHGIGSSISIQERNVKFLSKLAYYYLHNGNYDEACFILGLILREYPDDVRSLNNMAVALFESSKIDASLELLEKAIQIFPDYLDALINKAVFLAESEVNPKEGMRILESLLEKPEYEKNESILKGLVKGYSVLADLPKTLVYFGKAKDANIEEESVYSDVGGAYFRNGNADLALDYFERALDKNPSSIDVLINKTTALIELGLLISAQVILERLQKQKPLNPLLITNLATVYSKQHKDDLAIVWGEIAYRLKDKDYVTLNNLGLFYSAIGDHNQAIDYFNCALKIKRDYLPALYNKSRDLIVLNKFQEALECIDELLKHDRSQLRSFYESIVYSKQVVIEEMRKRESWPEEYSR